NPLALRRRARQRRVEWKIDRDVGALARRARDCERAAQALDDVFRDRQTEAGAAALGGEVRIEHLREIGAGDAGAVVGDADAHRLRPRTAAERDVAAIAMDGVPGVDE